MTWTRVKRWIGENPARRVNQAAVATLVACIPLVIVLTAIQNFFPSYWPADATYLVVGAFLFLAPTASSTTAGLICARAGIPVFKLFVGLSRTYVWVACCVAVGAAVAAIVNLCQGLPPWWGMSLYGALALCAVIWLALSVPLIMGHVTGCLIAAFVSRHMLRSGKWEHTVPVEPRAKP
jgi:hypothetical protein